MTILDCMQETTLLNCAKIFILHKMERRNFNFPNTGNFTQDFFGEMIKENRGSDGNWMKLYLDRFNETEVDKKLFNGFKKLLKNRYFGVDILPSMLFEMTPNDHDMFELSLKRTEGNFIEEGRDKEGDLKTNKKYYKHLAELGVPTIILPSMIFAGFLPIILPVLKMATFFTSFINHGALLASILYLAKQHAEEQEQKQTVYFNAGYN
jgi:hypothetical protein